MFHLVWNECPQWHRLAVAVHGYERCWLHGTVGCTKLQTIDTATHERLHMVVLRYVREPHASVVCHRLCEPLGHRSLVVACQSVVGHHPPVQQHHVGLHCGHAIQVVRQRLALSDLHMLVHVNESNPSVFVSVPTVAVSIRLALCRLLVAPVDDLHALIVKRRHGFVAPSIVVDKEPFHAHQQVVVYPLMKVSLLLSGYTAQGHVLDAHLTRRRLPQRFMLVQPCLGFFVLLAPRSAPHVLHSLADVHLSQRRAVRPFNVFQECRPRVVPASFVGAGHNAPAAHTVVVVDAQPAALRRIDEAQHRPQPLHRLRVVPPLVYEAAGRHRIVKHIVDGSFQQDVRVAEHERPVHVLNQPLHAHHVLCAAEVSQSVLSVVLLVRPLCQFRVEVHQLSP